METHHIYFVRQLKDRRRPKLSHCLPPSKSAYTAAICLDLCVLPSLHHPVLGFLSKQRGFWRLKMNFLLAGTFPSLNRGSWSEYLPKTRWIFFPSSFFSSRPCRNFAHARTFSQTPVSKRSKLPRHFARNPGVTFIHLFRKFSLSSHLEPNVELFEDKNSFVWDVKAGFSIKQFTNRKRWFFTCAAFTGTP